MWSRVQFVSQRSVVLSFLTIFLLNVKDRVKVTPLQARCGPEGGYSYSSTLSMTAALEGGEWSAARPGCNLPLGKDPVRIVQ